MTHCFVKKDTKTCNKCREEIYFDPDKKSANDKFIPIDAITNEPHTCPNSNYKSVDSISEEILDLEERERERIRKLSYN